MKIFLILMLAGFGCLLALGVVLQISKSPEQKAAEAEQIRQYALKREEKRKEEQAYEMLKKIVEPARDTLELAYIQHVKDEGASHVACREAEFEKRFFIRCGIAYGSPETANNGLWEATGIDGKLVLYAMNGKALRALEKIGPNAEFQSGVGQKPVDTEELSKRF